MLSVDDASRIMAAVQLGQQLPIDTPEAVALAERMRSEMETFPPGVEVEVPGEWDIDDREELLSESLRFVLAESLVRSDRYRIVESSAGQSIMPGGGDHWKTQPRDKTGKWVDSGVDYDKWPQNNSAAMSAKKKIKLMEQMVADGNYAAFAAAAPIINSKQPNSYQKGILKAYANLHEIVKKAQQAPPKGAVQVPGSPALAGWSKIGGSLGTEKGGTYIGPDGKKYYVKTPDNPARAHNEVLAFKLYELAGGNVVHSQLVNVEGKIGIATEWEDAEKLKWSHGDKVAASEDFALHAWLNNWDAVGAGSENPMDNIKLIKGQTTLVDAGGSLDYSGMGGSGKKKFSHEADEWNTLRDPKINKTMAQVFGGMTDHQLYHSAMRLHQVSYNDIFELVNEYHPGSQDDKNTMVDILTARKAAIIQKANALLMKHPNISIPDLVSDSSTQPPVVVMANPNTGAPEVIPKSPPAVVAATKTKVLPPPPIVMSAANPTAQAKLNSLYDAAVKGGVDALNAVKTNPDSKNTYAKKAHAYKMQLLNSLGDGAVGNPDHVSPPVQPTTEFATAKAAEKVATTNAAEATEALKTEGGKVAKALFSSPPGFAGSKASINEKHAADMIEFARAGNKAGIQAIDVPDGTKIGEYKKKLLGEMDQIPQKKAAFKKQKAEAEAKLEQAKKEQEKALAEFKAKYGTDFHAASKWLTKSGVVLKEVGWWNVTHENVPVPHVPGNVLSQQERYDLMLKGHDSWLKAPKAVQNAIKKFTGPYSTSINDDMVTTKGKPQKDLSKNAAKAVAKYSVDLPEGMYLSRKYTFKTGPGKHLVPGQVIFSNTIHSTSTDPKVWSGQTHMHITIGKGVKGLPAEHFSENSPEKEVVMGAKQRYAVTKYVPPDSSGIDHIYVLALPTGDVE